MEEGSNDRPEDSKSIEVVMGNELTANCLERILRMNAHLGDLGEVASHTSDSRIKKES